MEMNKRYRLIVNHEWLASSDSLDDINQMANNIWVAASQEENGYYGNFPDIIIYDMQEKCEV